MKHASLFTGIGGFDLAAAWAGWENIFQVEIDPFCRKILARHFPNVKRYNDVKTFNAESYANTINVLSAGFPCQPFSVAGKRKGQTDDRFLWPATMRIISNILPQWIVLENVTGLLSILESESLNEMEVKTAELYSQDPSFQPEKTVLRLQRRIIGRIISDIRAAGYLLPVLSDGTPVIVCIPAIAVGAVHRRDRIWIIAHSDQHRKECNEPATVSDFNRDDQIHGEKWPWQPGQSGQISKDRPSAHSDDRYLEGQPKTGDTDKDASKSFPQPSGIFEYVDWENWPTQSPLCGRNDGLSLKLDNITFSKWRNESLKAYGNAIVPQVAFEIFKAIASSSTPK
ncbi:DNA cytosine methyltransferase [Chitinophaga sp. CC14]|uniref:DNA cytosine methyltransferase n=1 Tax=Chitinophaga sp. CC14 TaxID=3029199 RepID=UPI003B7E62EC